MESKKVALFHPWIKSRGGAERVVLELAKDKKFDVYTWVYDKDNTFSGFGKLDVHVIAPRFFGKLARSYILRGLFLFAGLYKIPLEKYDKFLISTGGLAEFIVFRNYKKKQTYAYVHTPLRAANNDDVKWNLKHRYRRSLLKLPYLSAVYIYKIFEKLAWKRIDFAIFNSELTEKRAKDNKLIKKQGVKVIYPPVNIGDLSRLKNGKNSHFLYIARFGLAKRQEFLLKAWKEFVKEFPNEKLVLLGNKENKKYFSKMAKMAKKIPGVALIPDANDKEWLDSYRDCKAFFLVNLGEDFGITPFEAVAAKKHLIAVDEGGYVPILKKKGASVTWIKEREPLEKEILSSLRKFMKKKKPICKRIDLEELRPSSFVKKIKKELGV